MEGPRCTPLLLGLFLSAPASVILGSRSCSEKASHIARAAHTLQTQPPESDRLLH